MRCLHSLASKSHYSRAGGRHRWVPVGWPRAGSSSRNPPAGFTEKGDSHAIDQSISPSFLLLLSRVWCGKPRKTFGCVVKAMWCNPMKITDFWSSFCVKSCLLWKTCLQLALQLCLCCVWLFHRRKSHIWVRTFSLTEIKLSKDF